MIVDLGHWVLRNAVRQLRRWQQDLKVDADFNVRVNISTTELQNLDLIEHVRDILREQGWTPPTSSWNRRSPSPSTAGMWTVLPQRAAAAGCAA